jgi:tetratricopeptide (TPR) repeat protein
MCAAASAGGHVPEVRFHSRRVSLACFGRRVLLVALLLLPVSLHAQVPPGAPRAPAAAPSVAELQRALRRVAPDRTGERALAHNALGVQYLRESRFDSALVHLEQARALWTDLGDTVGLGRVFNNIGASYYQSGHFEPALAAFHRSLELRQHLGDHAGEARVLTNIGLTFRDLQLYDRARPALDSAYAAAARAGAPVGIGYALHHLGTLHLATGDYAAARAVLNASLRQYEEASAAGLSPAETLSGWVLNMTALGLLHVREGDPDGAIAILERVLSDTVAESEQRRQATALLHLGRAYRARGESAAAIAVLERSFAISSERAQRTLSLEALLELADAYEAQGDTRSALHRLRAHGRLREEVFSQHSVQRIAAAEARERELDQLAANARLREERQAREAVIARQRLAGGLGGALLLVFAILAAVLVYFNREARARQVLLSSANAALAETNVVLRAALADVRTLEGLIPICASCKRIRDDDGFWEAVETYISDRSDVLFSHSICAECGPRIYGDDWHAPPQAHDSASAHVIVRPAGAADTGALQSVTTPSDTR